MGKVYLLIRNVRRYKGRYFIIYEDFFAKSFLNTHLTKG